MGRPILSIGMIVKNEMRCIKRCLDSLKPLRDALDCELVIADTGSTDGTREIIEEYADICFDFEWIKDFAAARNAVLDRCNGLWHFQLDADEWLDDDISDLVAFFKSAKSVNADSIIMMLHNDMGGGTFKQAKMIRIVRLKKRLRYEGIVHEHYNIPPQNSVFVSTKFYHDGYSYDNEDNRAKKDKRNSELLEVLFEQNPDHVYTILQCIESSSTMPEKQKEYILHGLEVIKKSPKSLKYPIHAALLANCVRSLNIQKAPEIEEALEWTKQNCVYIEHSPYYIDLCHAAAVWCGKNKKEDLWFWLNAYLKITETMEQIPTAKMTDLLCVTPVYNDSPKEKFEFLTFQISQLMEQEEKDVEQISALFTKLKFPNYNDNNIIRYFTVAQLFPKEYVVQQQVALLFQKLESDASKTKLLRKIAFQMFQNSKEPWRLFLQLQNDIGTIARIFDADAQTAPNIVKEITDWKSYPVEIVYHLMSLGVDLPNTFYAQPQETLTQIAASCLQGKRKENVPAIFEWIQKQCKQPMTLLQQQFYLNLLIAACRVFDWKDNVLAHRMTISLLDIAQPYFKQYYAPALLDEKQNWNVLPTLHTYILYLLEGREILKQGDQLQWTKQLQSALMVAPVMKKMVKYLIEYPPIVVNMNPELQALAQQINQILSKYAPDDPAILALKQSPVYQQVAHLLV